MAVEVAVVAATAAAVEATAAVAVVFMAAVEEDSMVAEAAADTVVVATPVADTVVVATPVADTVVVATPVEDTGVDTPAVTAAEWAVCLLAGSEAAAWVPPIDPISCPATLVPKPALAIAPTSPRVISRAQRPPGQDWERRAVLISYLVTLQTRAI
jgi:hypothetical protein